MGKTIKEKKIMKTKKREKGKTKWDLPLKGKRKCVCHRMRVVCLSS